MKRFLSLLIFMLSCCFGNAQSKETATEKQTRETYLQKSKSARSTGFVSLGIGLALIGTSLLTEDSSPSFSTATGYVGVLASIASIPFFIKAGNYKRKANLALKKVSIPSLTSLNKTIPVVSVSISF